MALSGIAIVIGLFALMMAVNRVVAALDHLTASTARPQLLQEGDNKPTPVKEERKS